jgi:molecular chaperone GrpE
MQDQGKSNVQETRELRGASPVRQNGMTPEPQNGVAAKDNAIPVPDNNSAVPASSTAPAKNDGASTQIDAPTPAPSPAEKLASVEAKAMEMEDAFLRAKAELENYRRRASQDIERANKYAIEDFAEALMPVKDSLETALKVDTPSLESLKKGVEITLKQLDSAFEKNQLAEINPKPGDKLDPMLHQAISMVPTGQNANTIISVLQKGYKIADRLLRPALVTVSQGGQADAAAQSSP